VAEGRKPNVFACGFCHRADGPGGPENASLAGQPAAYLIQQVNEFKSGARKTSVPGRNVDLMIALVQDITDEELKSAADYFAALKPRKTIEVREVESVPTTHVAGNFLASNEDGTTEPLNGRIIEVPENLEQFENRDTHSRFIAYVPTGSVARGEALATMGNSGKTIPCATCHGPDLRGLGGTPSIAGRSPSYMMRQLYDIKHGARAGASTPLMTAVLANLAEDDMRDLVAYLATLEP
jgi:cytochrome c553